MSTQAQPKRPTRFKIGDEIYEFGSASDLTTRDILLLDLETEQLGRKLTMGDIVRLGEEFKDLTKDEAARHPESGWMFAVTMWMAMVKKTRDTGDYTTRVPFAAAIDFPLDQFQEIKDPVAPSDHQPPASGSGPKKPRSGSGRGGGKAARTRAPKG